MIEYDQKIITEFGQISEEVYDNDPSGIKYFKDNPDQMLIDTVFGITSYTVIDYISTDTDMQALLLQKNDGIAKTSKRHKVLK
ncbi:MAG: hypothetical protein RBR03_03575 [Desulfuromonas thiophila]|jgi:hypothetical protein|nr:hypothetical protein [Desulfuromonas thiophila]